MEDHPITMQGHQPTFVSVDAECIRRAIDVCEIAIEHTKFCIHDFKQRNSYKQKELFLLRQLERDMEKSEASQNELRKVLGWPEV